MKKYLSVAAVICVLLWSGGAFANTESFTSPLVSSLTELKTPIVLPQFNHPGFTLTGISILVNGGLSGTIALTNNGSASETATGTTNSQFAIGAMNGFTAADTALFTMSYTTGLQTIAPHTTFTSPTLAGAGSATINDSTVFAPYTGSGNYNIPLDFGGTQYTLTGLSITGGGGNLSGSQATSASGQATVTYTYTTTTVPEPVTLLLLGFGLVGLVGVGRKFKK